MQAQNVGFMTITEILLTSVIIFDFFCKNRVVIFYFAANFT